MHISMYRRTNSPVILLFNLYLIATKTVSTVSGTEKCALQHIKSLGESREGKVFFCDLLWPFLVIFSSTSSVHYPNHSNWVQNDWSYHKQQFDTCLVSIA